ncbi:MAG: DUF2862 domain-containing protein [Pseudanabaena sp.]|jgi:hypothetical protein|nr:DUF2862 domain-containing protein [Pseudanabaena sp. M090S1SP2A07QC]MCA6508204.1 DUF2862 domain-containing protein [Pseudanabaena sp. M172S2SP2A07QC]MCA6510017.1 DUF2862 domain-containing protein [Pseudanabaena sp. M109S1SP2A07QC]MCA6522495.1 DUF2862 domain-containing protein [Pseudanabaena sp. M051S1SP2A07QC]MCA6527238.1 DUF2862 domain-containing protein [Pseudanabaena sp. M179S2SP2A07QC]MCA6530902.1 DUF2862 domain-containing protein [Pseudanabaena sp. M125S2SP2A07QC]MCA6533194.1 DUF2862 
MQVGQKVRVRSFKDGSGKAIANKVGEIGVIKEEKIMDGSKWGYVVKFPDSTKSWFFADELESVV